MKAAGSEGHDAADAEMLCASEAVRVERRLGRGRSRGAAFGGRGWSTLFRPGRHLMDVRVVPASTRGRMRY